MQDIIGIDISKDQLDTYRLSDRQHAVFDNDKTGFKALLKWIDRAGELRIVYEPTGPYHRGMEDALAQAGHALVKVNPRQARRFAEATGTQAKTDRIDAMLLARMGLALDLPSRPVRGDMMNNLREIHVARLALVKERTAASNRASAAQNTVLKRQSKARLAFIERQLSELEEAIAAPIAADPNLSARRDILTSIPGIGLVTAHMLLIEMPELGALEPKQAASLAGLAPFTRRSGKWKGKEMIRGGRAALRSAIFMPALVAVRFSADRKRKYQALLEKRKPPKVAITAAMRKLILLANALLRDGRKWNERPA